MPRDTSQTRLFRCVESFAVFSGNVPTVYTEGQEVLDGNPILRTHRKHFEDATSRVMRTTQHIERATAAPGGMRTVSTPSEGATQ